MDSQGQAGSRTGLSPNLFGGFQQGREKETPHRRDGMQAGATVTGIVIFDSTCQCSVLVVRAYLLYSVLKHF